MLKSWRWVYLNQKMRRAIPSLIFTCFPTVAVMLFLLWTWELPVGVTDRCVCVCASRCACVHVWSCVCVCCNGDYSPVMRQGCTRLPHTALSPTSTGRTERPSSGDYREWWGWDWDTGERLGKREREGAVQKRRLKEGKKGNEEGTE